MKLISVRGFAASRAESPPAFCVVRLLFGGQCHWPRGFAAFLAESLRLSVLCSLLFSGQAADPVNRVSDAVHQVQAKARSFKHKVALKALLLIAGIILATAGGVITYRALYVEPKAGIVITSSDVRELPNYTRVVSGALMFVGGTALALYAATRRPK